MKATLTLDLEDIISKKVEDAIMATLADFNAKLDSIEAKLQTLKDQIASRGMPDTDEDAVLGRLNTLESGLDAALATTGPTAPTEPDVNPDEPPPAPEPPAEEGA